MAEETDKDAEIAKLRQKVARLMHALRTIDADVDRAARNHLHSTVPKGYIKFGKFVELLVAEIRREERNAARDPMKFRELMRTELEARLEARLDEMLPTLKGSLNQYLTIPVVIIPARKNIPDHMAMKKLGYFRAASVRGNIRHGQGETPEAAYADLRERLAAEIFGLGPKDMARRIGIKDMQLMKEFEAGKPSGADEIEGFKIEIRTASRAWVA